MTRILWIVGLGIALLVNGGFTVGIMYSSIVHKHLTLLGFFNLIWFVAITWLVFSYLRVKICEKRQLPIASQTAN
jgi:hypothetical protein